MQHTLHSISGNNEVQGIAIRCNAGLARYLRSKGFEGNLDSMIFPADRSHGLAVLCRAATALSPEYDVGIGLAWGGAPISFIFEKHGLPIRLVDMKRKGFGASWRPIDKLSGHLLKGRRVLVLEGDVFAGRTLKRALRELEEYRPDKIDLLLHVGHTSMPIKDYIKSLKRGSMPILPKEAIEETLKVLRYSRKKIKQQKLEGNKITFQFNDGTTKTIGELLLDLKRNIPSGFHKIMSVSGDFSFYTDDYKVRLPLTDSEKKTLVQVNRNAPNWDMWVTGLKTHYLTSLDGLLKG